MSNIRTFKNLQDETLAWLDEAGDTNVTLTLVKQSLRAAHEKRLTEERWAFMLSRPLTFPTVVGQQFYSLDADFQRLMYAKNLTTRELLIESSDQNVLDTGYDWSVDTDSARSFALWGRSEVQSQPVTAAVIAVTSSNAGDNGMSTVTIRGNTLTGIQTETITCNGSGLVPFNEVLKVTKSSGWVGTMTLTAGGLPLLSLGASEYGKSYQPFYLLAKPQAVETIEYRFYRQPSPMIADNDRPDYPPPFETLLVWEALLDMAVYNSYDSSMVEYWSQRRNGLLQSMEVSTNQAQTINQQSVYTNYLPR